MAQQYVDLLLKEIEDPYVQENFRKLRSFLGKTSTGTQGPRGLQGPPGAPGETLWESLEGIIPASSTQNLYSELLANFGSGRFMLKFQGGTPQKNYALEITGSKTVADEVNDSVFGKIGDYINISLNLLKIGSDVVLQADNNESFDVHFTGIRRIFD